MIHVITFSICYKYIYYTQTHILTFPSYPKYGIVYLMEYTRGECRTNAETYTEQQMGTNILHQKIPKE